jgi:hypothetical protein
MGMMKAICEEGESNLAMAGEPIGLEKEREEADGGFWPVTRLLTKLYHEGKHDTTELTNCDLIELLDALCDGLDEYERVTASLEE